MMALLKGFKMSVLIMTLYFCASFSCLAQPPGGMPPKAKNPPGTGPPGDPATDPDVPISGIEFLILAGGAYGAKKYVDHQKKKNSSAS